MSLIGTQRLTAICPLSGWSGHRRVSGPCPETFIAEEDRNPSALYGAEPSLRNRRWCPIENPNAGTITRRPHPRFRADKPPRLGCGHHPRGSPSGRCRNQKGWDTRPQPLEAWFKSLP